MKEYIAYNCAAAVRYDVIKETFMSFRGLRVEWHLIWNPVPAMLNMPLCIFNYQNIHPKAK